MDTPSDMDGKENVPESQPSRTVDGLLTTPSASALVSPERTVRQPLANLERKGKKCLLAYTPPDDELSEILRIKIEVRSVATMVGENFLCVQQMKRKRRYQRKQTHIDASTQTDLPLMQESAACIDDMLISTRCTDAIPVERCPACSNLSYKTLELFPLSELCIRHQLQSVKEKIKLASSRPKARVFIKDIYPYHFTIVSPTPKALPNTSEKSTSTSILAKTISVEPARTSPSRMRPSGTSSNDNRLSLSKATASLSGATSLSEQPSTQPMALTDNLHAHWKPKSLPVTCQMSQAKLKTVNKALFRSPLKKATVSKACEEEARGQSGDLTTIPLPDTESSRRYGTSCINHSMTMAEFYAEVYGIKVTHPNESSKYSTTPIRRPTSPKFLSPGSNRKIPAEQYYAGSYNMPFELADCSFSNDESPGKTFGGHLSPTQPPSEGHLSPTPRKSVGHLSPRLQSSTSYQEPQSPRTPPTQYFKTNIYGTRKRSQWTGEALMKATLPVGRKRTKSEAAREAAVLLAAAAEAMETGSSDGAGVTDFRLLSSERGAGIDYSPPGVMKGMTDSQLEDMMLQQAIEESLAETLPRFPGSEHAATKRFEDDMLLPDMHLVEEDEGSPCLTDPQHHKRLNEAMDNQQDLQQQRQQLEEKLNELKNILEKKTKKAGTHLSEEEWATWQDLFGEKISGQGIQGQQEKDKEQRPLAARTLSAGEVRDEDVVTAAEAMDAGSRGWATVEDCTHMSYKRGAGFEDGLHLKLNLPRPPRPPRPPNPSPNPSPAHSQSQSQSHLPSLTTRTQRNPSKIRTRASVRMRELKESAASGASGASGVTGLLAIAKSISPRKRHTEHSRSGASSAAKTTTTTSASNTATAFQTGILGGYLTSPPLIPIHHNIESEDFMEICYDEDDTESSDVNIVRNTGEQSSRHTGEDAEVGEEEVEEEIVEEEEVEQKVEEQELEEEITSKSPSHDPPPTGLSRGDKFASD